jgi:hypothetical protein
LKDARITVKPKTEAFFRTLLGGYEVTKVRALQQLAALGN